MEVPSSKEDMDVAFQQMERNLNGMSKLLDKLKTIQFSTVLSALINSIPPETPGLNDAVRNINDIFFNTRQPCHNVSACILIHEDFLSLRRDLDNILRVVRQFTGNGRVSEAQKRPPDRRHSNNKSKNVGPVNETEDAFEKSPIVEVGGASQICLKNLKREVMVPEVQIKEEAVEDDDDDEEEESIVVNENFEQILLPSSLNLEAKGFGFEEDDPLVDNVSRQNLKELIAWICKEVTQNHTIPTSTNLLRGQPPAHYGLSKTNCKFFNEYSQNHMKCSRPLCSLAGPKD